MKDNDRSSESLGENPTTKSWQRKPVKTTTGMNFLAAKESAEIATSKEVQELLTRTAEPNDAIVKIAPQFKRLADLPSEIVDYLLDVVFEKCFNFLSKLTVDNLLTCLKTVWNFQEVKSTSERLTNKVQHGVSFRLHGDSQPIFITPKEIQQKLAVMFS